MPLVLEVLLAVADCWGDRARIRGLASRLAVPDSGLLALGTALDGPGRSARKERYNKACTYE